MAVELVEILSALFQTVAVIVDSSGRRAKKNNVADSIRSVLAPVPGVEVVTADGSLLTGVVVIADNAPLLMFVARHTPPARTRLGFFSQGHSPDSSDAWRVEE